MELKAISNDVLGNIMSRLEGTSLASIACTCSDLCELARDEAHWERLCKSTWPSTGRQEARRFVSASNSGGFAQFYASSFPLIVYDHKATTSKIVDAVDTSPGDLVSLVDVFLNDKCVLSRVLDGIPSKMDQKLGGSGIGEKGGESWRWFLNSPFQWDLLDQDQVTEDVLGASFDDSPMEDQSEEMMRGTLRLSWILFDKKSGRAVNLSSWKPLLVQMNGPYDDNCVARFGCVLPVQQSLLPHKLAKCIITTRFKMGPDCLKGSLHWKELSLVIEDIEGAHVYGEKSLKILNQALSTSRSINQLKVEEGLSRYDEEKSRTFERKEFTEKLSGGIFILIETTAFVTCCYALRNLF